VTENCPSIRSTGRARWRKPAARFWSHTIKLITPTAATVPPGIAAAQRGSPESVPQQRFDLKGPRVRISFPPAERPRTLGPSRIPDGMGNVEYQSGEGGTGAGFSATAECDDFSATRDSVGFSATGFGGEV